MKKNISILAVCLVALMSSCTGTKSADAGTQVYAYNDSCPHLMLNFSLELPKGEDSVAMSIRQSLIDDFVANIMQPGYEEDTLGALTPFDGNVSDAQALVNHYGKACYDYLLKQAMDDYKERMSYVETDSTMTDEAKQYIEENVPMWAFEHKMEKSIDTPSFVVYTSKGYCYYGGAHGGVTGSGGLTFSKADGSMIEHFLKPESTPQLQSLLRGGLIQYYTEAGDAMTDEQLNERLFIDDGIVPQPQQVPYPNATADSLVFTYQQYEIACYADGMPSFTIAVKDLAPYLTDEAKALLKK